MTKLDQAFTVAAEAATAGPGASVKLPRHTRKLFDKLLISFHHACDDGDLEVAVSLLPILEMMTTRRPRVDETTRRRSMEGLVAAHERLWYLRHPG